MNEHDYSDNIKLPTNMRQRVSNGTLTIENIQRTSDQGTYTCTAKNKHNYTSQKSVEVKVLGEFTTVFYFLSLPLNIILDLMFHITIHILMKMEAEKCSIACNETQKEKTYVSVTLNVTQKT